MNLGVAYPVLGVYIILILGGGILASWLNMRVKSNDKVREHFMTTSGLGGVVWFFSMMATLFSGYSVSGIVNEAYRSGWIVTRWIAAGVGIYIAFSLLAPRLHALGKARGYFTPSQYLHDRFMPPAAGRAWVGHAIALLAFACLQLPVFTYLITQFRSLGQEVFAFTGGAIGYNTSVLTAAGLLLVCDVLGGMRAVAFTDLLQGVVLVIGSVVFLIVQRTELGGLHKAWAFFSNPALTAGKPFPQRALLGRVWWLQHIPPRNDIVYYFDFVAKTTLAATMFPHLIMRLFAARSTSVMRRGMACMNFTFFIVQLSSMITGWTAVYALSRVRVSGSAFGAMLRLVAANGDGQAFAAAMLLAAAICAMMSTADSALLAFSSMWVRDLYARYLRPRASQLEQLVFGKVMAFVGLAIGVGLAIANLKTITAANPGGTPDLSGLFAIQNVTPIHVVPAVWLSLHWRGLRGEAVLAGMGVGLAVTLGLLFDPEVNIGYKLGSDRLKCGLSAALVGFFANLAITCLAGWAQQYGPAAWAKARGLPAPPAAVYATDLALPVLTAAPLASAPPPLVAAKDVDLDVDVDVDGHAGAHARAAALAAASGAAFVPGIISSPLDIGPKRDRMLNPWLWAGVLLLLLFTTPFVRVPKSWDGYVGDIGAWAFTSLFLSGLLALLGVWMWLGQWEDYTVPYDPAYAAKAAAAAAAEQQHRQQALDLAYPGSGGTKGVSASDDSATAATAK